jgi:nicotinamide-nucleotide amidase
MIELISVGDEVLYGHTINSNAGFISKKLVEAGCLPRRHTVVGDDEKMLKNTLQDALKRKACVIITGGLGPTLDDKTRAVIADLFQKPLVLNSELLQKLQKRFQNLSSLADQALVDQATLPEGVEIIENEIGTASGFFIQDEALFPEAFLIALPGVPVEMKQMFERALIYVQKQGRQKRLFCKTLHFALVSETEFDPILRTIQQEFPEIQCGIYPEQASVSIHLKAHADDEKSFLQRIEKPLRSFDRFSSHRFESSSGTIEEALHNLLIEKKISLSLAESCTGGTISSHIVFNPNASSYFYGSIVAYSNNSKTKLLDVPKSLIQEKGAVSEEVALCMANGARKAFGTRCSLAVTGIAGPTGGTLQKPVGTICFAISYADTPAFAWTMQRQGPRRFIIEKATQMAFAQLYLFLKPQ